MGGTRDHADPRRTGLNVKKTTPAFFQATEGSTDRSSSLIQVEMVLRPRAPETSGNDL